MDTVRHDFCPACDRYVGGSSVCPFCEEPQPARIRSLRRGMVCFALVGCLLLGMASRLAVPTPVRAGSLSRSYHGAYVSVDGVVTRAPDLRRDWSGREYLYFDVHDGSGRIRVLVPEQVARDWMSQQDVPGLHDRVNVTGTISVPSSGAVQLLCSETERVHTSQSSGALRE